MENSEKESTSPAEHMEACRSLAKRAVVSSIYQLWPTADRRPEELKLMLEFDEAARFLSRNPGGVMQVVFNWAVNGYRGRDEVEYLNASFRMATAKFIREMINALIAAKIAEQLFKHKYPDPEWLE